MDEKMLPDWVRLVYEQGILIERIAERLTVLERYLKMTEIRTDPRPDRELSQALDAELHRQLDAYRRSQGHKPPKPLDFED